MSAHPRVVAISRSRAYSPRQHATNDHAILEATAAELEQLGCRIRRVDEAALLKDGLPRADLYLNMGQGVASARALLEAEAAGLRFFNRPSSVLRCHRHRLVPILQSSGLAFPRTVLLRTDSRPADAEALALTGLGPGPLWLKRGGVHAERVEDVRKIERQELTGGLAEFAARGIRSAAVQAHVPGPVAKFYALLDGTLFHAYLADTGSPVPAAELEGVRSLAFQAARRLKLDVFGGDVVFAAPGRPVLIDLNDWPSFAPIRDRAARAISRYVHAARPQGVFL